MVKKIPLLLIAAVVLLPQVSRASPNDFPLRTVTVKVYLDEDLYAEREDEPLKGFIKNLISAVSKRFEEEKEFRISFVLTGIYRWRIKPGESELHGSKTLDLLEENITKSDDADLLLGITAKNLINCVVEKDKIKVASCDGMAYVSGRAILLKLNTRPAPHIYREHSKVDELTLLHELGHIFGVVGHKSEGIMHESRSQDFWDEDSKQTIMRNRHRIFKPRDTP